MGRPVVASPEAASGIRAAPLQEIMLARDPLGFVRALETIITGRAAGLGAAGRAFVERSFTWNLALAPLDKLLGLAAEPTQTPDTKLV